MLIINADDWGRSQPETDAALDCFRHRRITSVSAMVFMADSERAAEIANQAGMDVGLHLNFSQGWDGKVESPELRESHRRIVSFLTRYKRMLILYHPGLRHAFADVYAAQVEEFLRLYGKPPSHIDGHQHKHLCTNMLVWGLIPRGQIVRRNFSFWPGEKTPLNRLYRLLVDHWLKRRYQLVDFFFALSHRLRDNSLGRVRDLAGTATVELMTHPANNREKEFLSSNEQFQVLSGVPLGSFGALQSALGQNGSATARSQLLDCKTA